MDVEELVWLKVNPGSVLVDVRLKVKVVEGQLRQLTLAADPRLRMLQVKGDDVQAVEGRAAPGNRSRSCCNGRDRSPAVRSSRGGSC